MSDQAAAFIYVFVYCDVSVAIVTQHPRAFEQATQGEQEELETEGAEGNNTTPSSPEAGTSGVTTPVRKRKGCSLTLGAKKSRASKDEPPQWFMSHLDKQNQIMEDIRDTMSKRNDLLQALVDNLKH